MNTEKIVFLGIFMALLISNNSANDKNHCNDGNTMCLNLQTKPSLQG